MKFNREKDEEHKYAYIDCHTFKRRSDIFHESNSSLKMSGESEKTISLEEADIIAGVRKN